MPGINVVTGERATRWTSAPTRHIRVGGETITYRDLGVDGGIPAVLLTHLGAALDEWDLHVVDTLAVGRRVIAVDPPGVGGSTGRVPYTGKDMANVAWAFISALGLTRIDLVGLSLEGFVTQQAALEASSLVRRLILTGADPAGGGGINWPTGAAYVYIGMLRAVPACTDAKELFFFPYTPEGKAAARNYLARIRERVMDRDTPMTLRAFHTQLAAIKGWSHQQSHDLSRITTPTLIADGDYDRVVPASLSEDICQRTPNSTLVIYPDAGHSDVFHCYQGSIPTLLARLDT